MFRAVKNEVKRFSDDAKRNRKLPISHLHAEWRRFVAKQRLLDKIANDKTRVKKIVCIERVWRLGQGNYNSTDNTSHYLSYSRRTMRFAKGYDNAALQFVS